MGVTLGITMLTEWQSGRSRSETRTALIGHNGHCETHVGRGRIGRNGVAADRMIVAHSRGDGAATNYEIVWVTVALQYPRAGTILGPYRCRTVTYGHLYKGQRPCADDGLRRSVRTSPPPHTPSGLSSPAEQTGEEPPV
jgi:hypothetical protein